MSDLVGLILLGLAVPVHGYAVWLFVTRGRGTPLPIAPPEKLVVQGPYRYTRNPMALAFVAEVVGLSLLFAWDSGLVAAVVVALVLHAYITLREEPTLRRRFGESYVAYCRAVPRWLPRPRKKTRAGG